MLLITLGFAKSVNHMISKATIYGSFLLLVSYTSAIVIYKNAFLFVITAVLFFMRSVLCYKIAFLFFIIEALCFKIVILLYKIPIPSHKLRFLFYRMACLLYNKPYLLYIEALFIHPAAIKKRKPVYKYLKISLTFKIFINTQCEFANHKIFNSTNPDFLKKHLKH